MSYRLYPATDKETCENMDTSENNLREIEKVIQQESFGTIWIDFNKKKNAKENWRRKLKRQLLNMRK